VASSTTPGSFKREGRALRVSGVASATLLLSARHAARANWLWRKSAAARKAFFVFLLRVFAGRASLAAVARVARSCRSPRCQRSSLSSVSALNAEDGAPGRWGPKTKVGNKCTASQATVQRASPLVVAASLKSVVLSIMMLALAGPGRAEADWVPEVRRWSRVKAGLTRQNLTAGAWGRSGGVCSAA
jgi:hypothetical protein